MSAPEPSTPRARRPGSLWRTIVAVAWSFFGVRKGSEYEQDIARLNPFHIIAVGIAACFLFVLALMLLVHWVVAK